MRVEPASPNRDTKPRNSTARRPTPSLCAGTNHWDPFRGIVAVRVPLHAKVDLEGAVTRVFVVLGRAGAEAECEKARQGLPSLCMQHEGLQLDSDSGATHSVAVAERDVGQADVDVAQQRIDQRPHLPRLKRWRTIGAAAAAATATAATAAAITLTHAHRS